VCCYSHSYRELNAEGDPIPLAENDNVRCTCFTGLTRCARRATGEDMSCDYCSGRGTGNLEDKAPRVEPIADFKLRSDYSPYPYRDIGFGP
jgi:hypothetical protein